MHESLAVSEGSLGIKGMLPSSMLDWEGKLAAVLFTGGCNLRCPFCHNADLVLSPEEIKDFPWARIEYHLNTKKRWLDGVCITGGEPTLNPNIGEITSKIKSCGFPVKLDTNGTKPNKVSELIDQGSIDYVAMDIKTSFDKYDLVTKKKGVEAKVKDSIERLVDFEKAGKIEVEFRTTFVPGIVDREDILEIAGHLAEARGRRYSIQQFNPKKVLNPSVAGNISPQPKDYLHKLALECSTMIPTKVK
ncbi:MAG: anaerobic ribonucleoside-triphosphate reductase activating protein [Actinobacteria bacterium]|nr:anaerobic ribonucleoside-triphosphate reductase activating protein [Actinomycetota bacterium]